MSAEPGERRWAIPAVYAVSLALAVCAAVMVALLPATSTSSFDSPWWLIIPIGISFAIAERYLFNFEFRREAISFSLSEVPTAFALAFLAPIPAIAARVVGSIVSIVYDMKPPRFKTVFNASLFMFESALAFTIVRLIAEPGPTDVGSFLVAAAAATMLTSLAGLVMVCIVISFFEGDFLGRLFGAFASTALTGMTGAMVGAAAVAPALIGLEYAWVSLIPIVGAWVVLRQHGNLSQRFRDLDDLHAFSSLLDRSLQVDLVAPRAVDEIARLVNADRVTLSLVDGDRTERRAWSVGEPIDPSSTGTRAEGGVWLPDDAEEESGAVASTSLFEVPIVADGDLLGVLSIAGCLGRAGAFGQYEVERACDLAEQLATSFRNGLLHASMERAAMHDVLTGDANRGAFEGRLAAELGRSSLDPFAVLVLDLNQFKEVNDTLGHHVGDQVLVEFARRVRRELRPGDLLSRFGGDEFAIMLRRTSMEAIRQLAERILSMSYTPLHLEACDAVVTASIGIAFVGDHDTDPSSILRRADIAMYAAKNQRSGIEVYREEIDRRTPARLSLLGDLRSAIERDELEVHYQPKVDLATSTVIGAEALVRWQHIDRGWVSPVDFIGVAEESGLVRLVTDVVLSRAIRRARMWADLGYDLDVSVNLSALDLHDQELAPRIEATLAEHGLDPKRLVVEITESALMVDTIRTMATIEQLDLLGVRLSLDDFGTGYSSLSHLRQLPVAELKIDRSFVSDLLLNVNDDVIVRSTIDLGHNLGLRVVAEGIENSQVSDHLRALGCDIGQGYGIARPLPPELFSRWLETTLHDVARLPESSGDAEPVGR